MNGMLRFAAILFLAAALAGCAAQRVVVDGYTDPDNPPTVGRGTDVCVVPPENASNPMLAREIASKIRLLLEDRGYVPVPCPEAKYALLFDYGVGQPRTVEDYWPVSQPSQTIPVTTTGTETGDYYVHVPGETIYVPYSRTVYDRWLRMRLVEAGPYAKDGTLTDAWIGEAVAPGQGSNLRGVVNYMLPALFDHFGRNTGQSVSRTVRGDNPEVQRLERQSGQGG